jgi:CRISPR-associated protein Cas1
MFLESEIESFEWIKVRVAFKSPFTDDLSQTSPIFIMEAINKAITDQTWGIQNQEWNRPIFHFTGRNHNFKLLPDETYNVEFIFTNKDINQIENWIQNLKEYFLKEENCRSLYPVEIGPLNKRNLSLLKDEIGEIPDEGEICFKFLTPLYFKPNQGKTRYFIDSHYFTKGLLSRFSRLFLKPLNYEINPEFETLPYYWEYTEIKRKSHSQPGTYQFINGCVGNLYFRGNYSKIKPLFYLATELHAGTKFSNSFGYFILYKDSLPFFDSRFPRQNEIENIAQEVIERYDEALLNLIQPESKELQIKDTVTSLFNKLNDGTYQPSPYKAFMIRTENGKERQVEQPEYHDLIAGLYALRLLSPVLDKAFEEESIGFRKGKSREKAIELVKEALNKGFLWVIESDIENFFPSINLKLLENLLDKYIPKKDKKFKSFIFSIIRAKYRLDEKVFERESGVVLGHPLSPSLANLYLDAFDEEIKSLDVKLIRYADDFLIFCKTKEQAEEIVQKVESILSGLSLKIKKEKTFIKSVLEGFEFLGFSFQGGEFDIFVAPEMRLLKKPLFIVEPYVMVTVNGNAVTIKKEGKILQSVPIRRISEILLMEKCVISTSLINKCLQNKIPLTMTLNNGYFQTTLRPESKEYFLISSIHENKYASLSTADHVSFAREIILRKIENYIHILYQKYSPELRIMLRDLKEIVRKIELSNDLNEIRGLEGLASRKLYSNINLLINNKIFHIQKRERKVPDRINSLLNFGSYLLYSRINALVRSAGLNPYLGFMHSPSDNYESLVSDIVDIFRPRLEKFIIKIINLKIIDENDFKEKNGAYYLNQDGKHKFLSYFEQELNQKQSANKFSFKEQITLQVRIIKDWVVKNTSLIFLKWSE